MRRIEKKANKEAFKEEEKTQKKIMMNRITQMQGVKVTWPLTLVPAMVFHCQTLMTWGSVPTGSKTVFKGHLVVLEWIVVISHKCRNYSGGRQCHLWEEKVSSLDEKTVAEVKDNFCWEAGVVKMVALQQNGQSHQQRGLEEQSKEFSQSFVCYLCLTFCKWYWAL